MLRKGVRGCIAVTKSENITAKLLTLVLSPVYTMGEGKCEEKVKELMRKAKKG